jgi:predicted nucleic acid-binding protein
MAKIFLDANIFIDLLEKRTDLSIDEFKEDTIFISPLSIHILLYVTKKKIPSEKLSGMLNFFSLMPLTESICQDAMIGPTSDFEDNIHLHSAIEADCEIFFTRDKELLDLRFFGKMRIVKEIE